MIGVMPAATQSVPTSQLSATAQLGRPSNPCEPAKAIPLPLDFSVSSIFTLSLNQLFDANYVSCIQTVFIDNSANGTTVSVNAQGTNQTVTIAAGMQAYVPLLAQVPDTLTFSSTGGVKVNFQLLNFFVPPASWAAK